MDRTILLVLLAAVIGLCSAGSGYNYIKPAREVGSIGPVVNSDGSTKSVYVFADPDEHQHNHRVSQQRPISYKPAVQYGRTTYSNKVAPQQQQRRVTYNQVLPQQRSVTYSQRAPQQKTITYSQQRPLTYNTVAPQQQISYNSNRVASQQLPFVTSQIVPQQQPFSYTQQQPIVYNQIVPQQIPINSYQIAPQQQQIQYNPFLIAAPAPVKQNLQVIFVKTPGYEAYTEALLKMAKEAIQSQTIVYVLSKEPDIAELTRRFQEIQATARQMPEVRFIKYKTDDEAVEAQKAIKAQYEALPGTSSSIGTPVFGTGIPTQSASINSSNSGSLLSPATPTLTTTSTSTSGNEDDLYSQKIPPFLPTGIDVVPGSSYLPPLKTGE